MSAAKRALFPDGYPAAAPPDPTPDEQRALRAALARRLAGTVPGEPTLLPSPASPLSPWLSFSFFFPRLRPAPAALAPVLLGATPADRARTLDALLDPLASPACNTHLVVMLLDCVLLAVFPELGVGGPSGAGNGQGGQGGQGERGSGGQSGRDGGVGSGDGSGSGA